MAACASCTPARKPLGGDVTIQVLVINLSASTERLAFQTRQLARLGMAFERVEAVTAAQLSEAEYRRLANSWERPIGRAEVACYLSHSRAWQQVLDSGVPALVLEDDALLSRHVPELLAELEGKTDIDLVTLEVRGRKKVVGKQRKTLGCGSHLLRLYQDRTGAAAYLLWPEGARKLIASGRRRGAALADAHIFTCYALRAFQVEPAAVVQLDQCEHYRLDCAMVTESAISSPSQPIPQPRGLLKTVSFKWRRIRGQLRMGLRQLAALGRAERREIDLRREDYHITAEVKK